MNFIDLQKQYTHIAARLQQRWNDILQHGQFILGKEVSELENKLADYVGHTHCVTVANGTDALQLALRALKIGAGDEVITPAFSFFATVEAILLVGATPVLVDIDPRTFNIDPALIKEKITAKTKAILYVNLFGQCAEFDAIHAIAKAHHLAVIEDAAQSFGATYKGKRSCQLGTISCTSFFPSKPLGCYGDGGACFTNDIALAEKLLSLRNHGQQQRYYHTEVGLNSRLDSLQAAVLLEKLTLFDNELQARQRVAEYYTYYLKDAEVVLPFISEGNRSCYAQYTIRTPQREAIQALLSAKGIPTAIHYPLALHHQPILHSYKATTHAPEAEKAAQEVLSLPFHPYLTEEEVKKVAELIAK